MGDEEPRLRRVVDARTGQRRLEEIDRVLAGVHQWARGMLTELGAQREQIEAIIPDDHLRRRQPRPCASDDYRERRLVGALEGDYQICLEATFDIVDEHPVTREPVLSRTVCLEAWDGESEPPADEVICVDYDALVAAGAAALAARDRRWADQS